MTDEKPGLAALIWSSGRFPYLIYMAGLVFFLGLLAGDRLPTVGLLVGTVVALVWALAGLVLLLRAWALRI